MNSKIVGAGALNTCPSPLSLRDISPHCGESPDSPLFTIIYYFFDKLKALHTAGLFSYPVKDYFAYFFFVCAEVEMIAAEWDDLTSARSESAP